MTASEGGLECAESPRADVGAVEPVLASDQALSGYYRIYIIGREVILVNMHFD